jgi:hypothetical protein
MPLAAIEPTDAGTSMAMFECRYPPCGRSHIVVLGKTAEQVSDAVVEAEATGFDKDGAGGGGREARLVALSVLSVARSCVMSAVFRRIELHEKAEDPVRHLPWEPVVRPKPFAYLLLNGTQIYGLFLVLGSCEFCEFKPFLRHVQKMRAEIGIRRFLR